MVCVCVCVGGGGGGGGGSYLKNRDQIMKVEMIGMKFRRHDEGFRGSGGMLLRTNFKF